MSETIPEDCISRDGPFEGITIVQRDDRAVALKVLKGLAPPVIQGHGRPIFPVKTRDDICPECKGRGYTRETSPVIKEGKTVCQGSGCPTCKGVGRVVK